MTSSYKTPQPRINYLLACLLFSGCLLNSPLSLSAVPVEDGAQYSVGFSPHNALPLIIDAIEREDTQILVAAYSFTSKPIAEALVRAYTRGVDVMVIADKKANSTQYTAVTYLANHKIPVRLNDRYAFFHHKYMVFNGNSFLTGSFNFSNNADKNNAENIIIMWNAPAGAKEFKDNFFKMWRESMNLDPSY